MLRRCLSAVLMPFTILSSTVNTVILNAAHFKVIVVSYRNMSSFTRLSIIRLLELAIVCAIIGLHWHSDNFGDLPTRFISTGTVGGYLIILVGLFAGGLMGTPVNRRVDLFFSLVGCVLFIASGALVIDAFNQVAYRSPARDRGLARGSLCVIEGALFLVDAFFTFRGEA